MVRSADVLVIGGGPAGAWAALTAATQGCRVILVDKGYFGTSGATAPSNTGTWCVPPGDGRRDAAERRTSRTGGLADADHVQRVLGAAYDGLLHLAGSGYAFPQDESGQPYIANLRGPDYMRFMRRAVKAAGVTVFDHHPALSLLADGHGVGGASGIDRQKGSPWRITAAAVVLATGGCAYGERMLGATGLTGDGYLMAAEAGARLSGMEFCSQYGIAPAHTSLNKGLLYRWATFLDEAGGVLDDAGADRHTMVAGALLKGRVYARLDKADARIQGWLRQAQPNCFLPFDRQAIDPFAQAFEITLRCEGTVRGVGGVRLADESGATGVAGLFAAGDTASREPLTGAVSGGGGPNASWAIASGRWAGRGAAMHARQAGTAASTRNVVALARAVVPHAGPQRDAPSARDAVEAVREHMLALDGNFFRSEPRLTRSAARLESLWQDLRGGYAGGIADPLRDREAIALLATSRWSLASAQLRRESRGMHRRTDHPATLDSFRRRVEVGGLDRVEARLVRDPVPEFA
jgi:succinate dehydrogenase/fumarate reductase flavoprotein subunit